MKIHNNETREQVLKETKVYQGDGERIEYRIITVVLRTMPNNVWLLSKVYKIFPGETIVHKLPKEEKKLYTHILLSPRDVLSGEQKRVFYQEVNVSNDMEV